MMCSKRGLGLVHVPHARCDATQHAHQLDYSKLTIIFLRDRDRNKKVIPRG